MNSNWVVEVTMLQRTGYSNTSLITKCELCEKNMVQNERIVYNEDMQKIKINFEYNRILRRA